MGHLPINSIIVLIVCIFSDVYTKYPVKSDADFKSISINEGDSLEIFCKTEKPMDFYHPGIEESEAYTTSNFTIFHDENNLGIITNVFRRSKAIHGDTGTYGCFDVQNVTNKKFDPQLKLFNKTYVFVKSRKNLFIEDIKKDVYEEGQGFYDNIGCRPTSPDVQVELERYKQGSRTILTSDKRVFYHPTNGFKLVNFSSEDSGLFVCKAKAKDGRYQEMVFHFVWYKPKYENVPIIRRYNPTPFLRGNPLKVSCSSFFDTSMKPSLTWELPKNKSFLRTTINVITEWYGDYSPAYFLIRSVLTIKNATDEDEGLYKCIFLNYETGERKVDKSYIKIYDPSVKYLNLTIDRPEKVFIRHPGESLDLRINIDAYPYKFENRWLNPLKNVISKSEKFLVQISWRMLSFAKLYIRDIEHSDAGIYTLEVTHETGIKSMQFELIVQGLESHYYMK